MDISIFLDVSVISSFINKYNVIYVVTKQYKSIFIYKMGKKHIINIFS